MKFVLSFLTLMVVVISVSASKCPGFKQEGSKYVKRTTCSISYCNPLTGERSALACPTYTNQRDLCSELQLKKEGCHYGLFEDKTKVYGGCCPVWKKFCPGNVGFNASKVPTITLPTGITDAFCSSFSG